MTKQLHIVQGGIKNGDKRWLERAAKTGGRSTPTWVAPKAAKIGDAAVVYIGGLGFFATAHIASTPIQRKDWKNRFGAALDSIRLIEPPISLGAIQRSVPRLKWAAYPRSITTPEIKVAEQITDLIKRRRTAKWSDLDEDSLSTANLAELRAAALAKARETAPSHEKKRFERLRSKAIHLYVLARAEGTCESCANAAPFQRSDGSPYLEPHHTDRLADDGPDHPAQVIALCPNCHRRAHYSSDSDTYNNRLKRKLVKLESF